MDPSKQIQLNQLKKGKIEISPIVIKHIQLFVFPVVTIIVVIFLTLYFLSPQITAIQTTINETNGQVELLERLETKQGKLSEIKNSKILSEFERLEKVLPSEKNIPQIINTLQMVQRQQEVIYEGLSIKPGIIDKDTPSEGPIKFSINVGGPPDKVIAYVAKLLDTIPIINIESLNLNTTEGYTRAILAVESYFYPLPGTLGAIDASLPVISKETQDSVSIVLGFQDPPVLLDIPLSGTPSGETSSQRSIFSL